MTLQRRDFLGLAGAGALLGALPLRSLAAQANAAKGGKVVVVGGGFAGATAAKYLRLWAPAIEVTLVEPNASFVSCPFSNRVLGGSLRIDELTVGYERLVRDRGVKLVRDTVSAIEDGRKQVRLASGTTLPYDRLILAPGIDFMYETLPGLASAEARERVLHSWKAGAQTVALRKQLESMRDGGVFALCIPKAPYRCPPGPYERVCQVAFYLKNHKPKSKILVLDANPDVQSKGKLFKAAWEGQYKGLVEYRPNSELEDVDARTLTAKLQFESVKADVLNVVPPQRAGAIARQAGLININDRWCGVDWLTLQSTARPDIHVVGDSTQSAPGMPKSGHMANQHGKIVADAVIALMTGRPVNDEPMIANTCYSWINDREVVHVASVHSYDPAQKTMVAVKGAGGLSPAPSATEGAFAMGWAKNIWEDMLA